MGLLQAGSWAQSVERLMVGTVGAYNGTAGFQVHYSIGEVFVNTLESGALTFTQGFQQPNLLVTAVPVTPVNTGLSLYPNPASGEVFLPIPTDRQIDLYLQVYNALGAKVLDRKIPPGGDDELQIDLRGFSPGTYFFFLAGDRGLYRHMQKLLVIRGAEAY